MSPTFIDGGAGALAIHDLGGDGPATLIIAHATGFHGRCYRAFAHELAREARVYALDFRAHGDSDSPTSPDGWGWSQMTADLLGAIDFIGGQRPGSALHGFGHSMGGAAMLDAHRIGPDLFESVNVFEPIVPPRPFEVGESVLVKSALGRSRSFESFEAAIARYSARPPLGLFRADVLDDYVRYGFAPSTDENGDDAVILKCLPEHEAETYRGAGGDIRIDQMASLAGPVTVGQSGDGHFPSQLAVAVAEMIPDGLLTPFSELSHFGPLQDPVIVADAQRRLITG